MSLEARIAKLEALCPARQVVWCEAGESTEQADEAIYIRWLEDAEPAPAPVPEPAPVPVVTPPEPTPSVPTPEPVPTRAAEPERLRPTPTRPPSSAGWT